MCEIDGQSGSSPDEKVVEVVVVVVVAVVVVGELSVAIVVDSSRL